MKQQDQINKIAWYLSVLGNKVKLLNSVNLQDLNVIAENFFRDLLNLALDLSLTNINIDVSNAAAIDLGDRSKRIAIQVTATTTFEKIKKTHSGFLKAGLQSDYDRLVVLIIGEKPSYRAETIGTSPSLVMKIKDDVWDSSNIIKAVTSLKSDKLQACLTFLEDQLHASPPNQAKELTTLVRLIEVLSTEGDFLPPDNLREDPDPKGKIEGRFADHADYLKSEFSRLHEIYGRLLQEVEQQSDLSRRKLQKLAGYLISWSDRILSQCGGDPKAALDVLVDRVLRLMETQDCDYDATAVRYYLIDQLIACNVFPNKQ